jgi:lipoprotein-anchoring transpeptidase ErfK/SrfK
MKRLILTCLCGCLLPMVASATVAAASSAAVNSSVDDRPTGDDALRLQVFLDQSNFGPGVIDGKVGRFTELAMISWNEVNGHPANDKTAVMNAAREAVTEVRIATTVPAVAAEWVNPKVPFKRSQLAGLKRVSYRSFGEFMAERYHTDVPFLIELNGDAVIRKLKPGDSLTVPNVTPFLIESLTGARHEAAEPMSQRHVVVDTKINQVRIFEAAPAALVVEPADGAGGADKIAARPNRGLLASFPITPGQPQFIRLGTWELRNMIELPWWRYDPQFLKTGRRSESAIQIPPGPNSPVGVIWNGTSRSGIGLHGTSDPETIGRARSAGCIRLANWDAVRLPQWIRPGATIEIR